MKNPHAVAMGRIGGKAGRGDKKRRSKAHYARMVKARLKNKSSQSVDTSA